MPYNYYGIPYNYNYLTGEYNKQYLLHLLAKKLNIHSLVHQAIQVPIHRFCRFLEDTSTYRLMVIENGVEFFRHRNVYTVLKKYCS